MVPCRARKLDPFHFIVVLCAGRDIDHFPGSPIAAGLSDGVSSLITVLGDAHYPERDCAILRPRVRIEQDERLTIEWLDRVHNILVLQAVVLGKEIASPVL